ncbi:MAG: SAM-dependent methyltransferase [Actinobacteria bacterium]|nr:SAM-dependent methyltransferase [Actinomycetota bacterium]MBU1609927.1 SAM-dependent methyltransferase [Actinomycetota bacterium]MBU2316447.1 SAM-dependent methyltransferase [Actinomycetota bacterium]MBU2384345.1 SAM-dependent methyltransferase [Actinomycetota bacterium]
MFLSDETVLVADTPLLRKARGAFFTPSGITNHIAEWAIRSSADRVLEPSTGDAAFLAAAVGRLRELGAGSPELYGVEIHGPSAAAAEQIVRAAGGSAQITVSDFFLVDAAPVYDAVIGNPPFIRYQDWSGEQRDRARFAALQQGVSLTGLASSWAAFVAHAAGFLKPGGRLALVLPAELLSVNYAAPIRRFLLERFASVELVVFDEQVFPDAEADTVLVKADGWNNPPLGSAILRQTRNASTLNALAQGSTWAPVDTTERWTPLALPSLTTATMARLRAQQSFVPLSDYGDTTLGSVTGANRYFSLSPARVADLGIPQRDLVRISPPGSAHLRGLELSSSAWRRLGEEGQSTWLLSPGQEPAESTLDYIASGSDTGIDTAYKCRVRKPWWRVPLLAPPDLFLTYMNADTARLTTNSAGTRHLNSVHGVYLCESARKLACEVLPVASLNSLTVLSAELVGRSYGGGILKLEPKEADKWWMPSVAILERDQMLLASLKPAVAQLLRERRLEAAIELVDEVVLRDLVDDQEREALASARVALAARRSVRGKSRNRSID